MCTWQQNIEDFWKLQLQIPPWSIGWWEIPTFPPDRNQLLRWSSQFSENIYPDPCRNTKNLVGKRVCPKGMK